MFLKSFNANHYIDYGRQRLFWKCSLDFERIYLRFGIGQPLYRLALLNVLRETAPHFLGIGADGVKVMDLPHDLFAHALETKA